MFSNLLPVTGSKAAIEESYSQLMLHIKERDAAAFEKGLRSMKPALLNHAGGTEKLPLLLVAALHDEPECAQLLLSMGSDPDATDPIGSTAVFFAARNNCESVLHVLLDSGADPNRARLSGASPVYIAAQNGSERALQMLLAAGADPNVAKEGGFTPLAISCLRNHSNCVAVLVKVRGA